MLLSPRAPPFPSPLEGLGVKRIADLPSPPAPLSGQAELPSPFTHASIPDLFHAKNQL